MRSPHFSNRVTSSSAARAPTRIPPTPTPPKVVTVVGNRSWQDSGVAIRQGQKVSLRASGERTGQMEFVSKENFIVRWKGADGAPFLVGASLDLIAPASGNLLLAMNDDQGMLKDNQGSVQVSISVGP